jgi:hypothetical protein
VEEHVQLSQLPLDLVEEGLAGRTAGWQRSVSGRQVEVQSRVRLWEHDLVEQHHSAAAKVP